MDLVDRNTGYTNLQYSCNDDFLLAVRNFYFLGDDVFQQETNKGEITEYSGVLVYPLASK